MIFQNTCNQRTRDNFTLAGGEQGRIGIYELNSYICLKEMESSYNRSGSAGTNGAYKHY
jgi:hypothetical protein